MLTRQEGMGVVEADTIFRWRHDCRFRIDHESYSFNLAVFGSVGQRETGKEHRSCLE